MDKSLIVRRETQIAAPPATVFAFLTDPQKILSWMGAEARDRGPPGRALSHQERLGAARPHRARAVPRGRSGPSARLQLRLGGGRGGAAGIGPGRDRSRRAGRRHTRSHDPQRTPQRRPMRRPRQGLGALSRPARNRRRRRRSGDRSRSGRARLGARLRFARARSGSSRTARRGPWIQPGREPRASKCNKWKQNGFHLLPFISRNLDISMGYGRRNKKILRLFGSPHRLHAKPSQARTHLRPAGAWRKRVLDSVSKNI